MEDPSALIDQLLAAGHISEEAVIEHSGRKTFRGFAAIRELGLVGGVGVGAEPGADRTGRDLDRIGVYRSAA